MHTALGLLRQLTEPMPRAIFNWNPIGVAERMTAADDFAWNAFGYTYNNYAREGFARNRLRFERSDFRWSSMVHGCVVCWVGPV